MFVVEPHFNTIIIIVKYGFIKLYHTLIIENVHTHDVVQAIMYIYTHVICY